MYKNFKHIHIHINTNFHKETKRQKYYIKQNIIVTAVVLSVKDLIEDCTFMYTNYYMLYTIDV